MRKNIISVMATLAFLPAVSFAAAPTLSDVLDASGISITGHASGSYAYSHLSADSVPGSGSSNQFTFDQGELTISKLPTEGFGALADVYIGQDVAAGTYNYGAASIFPTSTFNDYGDTGNELNLHQAYVQYATGGLTVIAGKFATLAGYEVASDALNFNATRSVLFSQQAFTLTGVRAGYKFNDVVTAYAGLSNSATVTPVTVDGDTHKTVELGVALAPIKGLAVNLTDYRGNDSAGAGKTNLFDVVAAYTIGSLTVAYNGDYNTIKPVGGGATNKTLGHALYADYQLSEKLRAGVRGELFKAWVPGAAANMKVKEITLTGGYSPAKNFDLVSDVRYGQTQVGAGGAHEVDYVLKAVYKF